jgi:hypothetical protein
LGGRGLGMGMESSTRVTAIEWKAQGICVGSSGVGSWELLYGRSAVLASSGTGVRLAVTLHLVDHYSLSRFSLLALHWQLQHHPASP